MSAARPAAVVPVANARVEPSGNRIVICSAMGPDGTGGPRGRPGTGSEPAAQDRGLRARRRSSGAAARRRRRRGRWSPVASSSTTWAVSAGRDALGLLGGVLVDVLLAGELADLVHHLVDDLAEHQPVVGPVDVAAHVDRAAEADLGRA